MKKSATILQVKEEFTRLKYEKAPHNWSVDDVYFANQKKWGTGELADDRTVGSYIPHGKS
jgi:hypothetical protein